MTGREATAAELRLCHKPEHVTAIRWPAVSQPRRARTAVSQLCAVSVCAVSAPGIPPVWPRLLTPAAAVPAHSSESAAGAVIDDYDDCYRNQDTPLASKLAVGTTVDVVKSVLRGDGATPPFALGFHCLRGNDTAFALRSHCLLLPKD